MRRSSKNAILLLSVFLLVVLAAAFWSTRHFPALVFGGEDSVGTWVSGTMLTIMATICMVISIRERWYPWVFLTIFFLLLSVDERFMLHEQLKQHIIFSSGTDSRWFYELPVIAGALAGMFVAFVLWRNLKWEGRVLLLIAVLFGLASVVIDIAAAGVFWEECCKLLAELAMVSGLVGRVGATKIPI